MSIKMDLKELRDEIKRIKRELDKPPIISLKKLIPYNKLEGIKQTSEAVDKFMFKYQSHTLQYFKDYKLWKEIKELL